MITIVDDDESVRTSTKMLLRSIGYEAQTFASADGLLNSGSLEETECLVLDVRMPGIDGLELQGRLRSEGCRIPILFVTAYGDDLLRRRAMECGAVDMLNKPFDAAAFLSIVEKALGTARSDGHISFKRLRQLAIGSLGDAGYVQVASVFTAEESAHFRGCADCIEALANIVRKLISDRDKTKNANQSG